jgi:hypothetical protein
LQQKLRQKVSQSNGSFTYHSTSWLQVDINFLEMVANGENLSMLPSKGGNSGRFGVENRTFYRACKEIFPKWRIRRQNRPNIKQALDPAILAD